MGTIGSIDNQELLFDETKITVELPSLDPTIVRDSMSCIDGKFYIAGDKLTLTFNNYGQLGVKLGKYPVKGSTFKAILRYVFDNHFNKVSERMITEKWVVIKGTFAFGKHREVKFLWRGETLIGIFTKDTKVRPTIKWYEKAIYKSKARGNMRAHNTVDYKVETPHDVYDKTEPMFTKEVEIQEILDFVTSLKRRMLSNEETELLRAVGSEVGVMVDNDITLDNYTTEQLQLELYNRG
jgi:hypothetical protein